jgi:hypothetical protein
MIRVRKGKLMITGLPDSVGLELITGIKILPDSICMNLQDGTTRAVHHLVISPESAAGIAQYLHSMTALSVTVQMNIP